MPEQRVEGMRGGEREREGGTREGEGDRQNQRKNGAGSHCRGRGHFGFFFSFLPEKKKGKGGEA